MNNEFETKKEDEINLLDLFTVLLRYRKLIIGITLCALVLAAGIYFVYPTYMNAKSAAKTPRRPQTRGRIVISLHRSARSYVSRQINAFFNDSELIFDSLKEAGLDNIKYTRKRISLNTRKGSDDSTDDLQILFEDINEDEDEDSSEESAVIQQVFLKDEKDRARAMYLIDRFLLANRALDNKIYVRSANVDRRTLRIVRIDNNNIEIHFRHGSRELVEAFLQDVFVRGNERISENIRPMAELAVNDYENFLKIPVMSESVRQLLEREYQNYVFLKNFLDGNISPLMILSKTVISETVLLPVVAAGSYKQSLIIILAGFIASVIFAFAHNAIRNIRNDEEAMNKIRDALGKSKT